MCSPWEVFYMEIRTLRKGSKRQIHEAARLLVDGFKDNWPDAWPDMEAALAEVEECLDDERICRVAVNAEGHVLGWIGAIKQYNGNVWELHPLVVSLEHRGQGIGKALVQDLERQVRERGGITIFVGSDDENNMTSLAGVDLYENLLERIANIENYKDHPFGFYVRMGFQIVGVVPDANGFGKPDILLAKRVRSQ